MSLEVNTSCLQEHKIAQKSIWQIFVHELVHHLPYGTLSVSLALMLLSLISVLFDLSCISLHHHYHDQVNDACGMTSGVDILFHSFHFAHILFAASGTMVTFHRYSKNIFAGIIIGVISSVVFCTIADILLPYAAGRLLG